MKTSIWIKGAGVDKIPTVREPEMELPSEEQKQQITGLEQRPPVFARIA